MEEEVKKILEAMAAHVMAAGGFPRMTQAYTALWCSDGNTATMIEFLVQQLAETNLRLKALEQR